MTESKMHPLPPPRVDRWISLTERPRNPRPTSPETSRAMASSSTQQNPTRPLSSIPERLSTLRSATSIDALDAIGFTLSAATDIWHDYQTRMFTLPEHVYDSLTADPVTGILDSPDLLLECALHHIRSLDAFASDTITTLQAMESIGLHRKFCIALLGPDLDRVILPGSLRTEVKRLLTARHRAVVAHFAGMWPYTRAAPGWLVLTIPSETTQS